MDRNTVGRGRINTIMNQYSSQNRKHRHENLSDIDQKEKEFDQKIMGN